MKKQALISIYRDQSYSIQDTVMDAKRLLKSEGKGIIFYTRYYSFANCQQLHWPKRAPASSDDIRSEIGKHCLPP